MSSQSPLQRLSDLMELEGTLEFKARQQAYAAATSIVTGMATYQDSDEVQLFNAFKHLVDRITEKMIQDGKELEQAKATESNAQQIAHS